MKRSRSRSPEPLRPKRPKIVDGTTGLTIEALFEHDRCLQPLSPYAFLDMNSQHKSPSLADVPIIPPPSTRSSQRSRSSSPSRVNDAQYRVNHLRRANIFIDDDNTTSDVWTYVEKIIGNVEFDSHLDRVSDKLWIKSKELVQKPSGEAEWTEMLHMLIDELKDQKLDIVRNRDWCEELKPPVHNPPPTIPRKRRENQTNLATHEATFESSSIGVSTSPRYNSQSVAFPLFRLKTPRPDICIGLSDKSLEADLVPKKGRNAARSFLVDLQDTANLISDPHVTPVGLRFPFLIVEAKAGATGGNLYQAQNQAAVGGSAALQILQNLRDLRENQDLGQTRSVSDIPHLVFSITTEGPIHEIWFHFRRPDEDDFYMSCIGSWRTTLKYDSQNLVRHLQAILQWGNGDFRSDVLCVLQTL
ncbi:hypothetical protein BO71DRAFT_411296 [Aspergillus ellipticus CBS 707.79]|uniref:DUF7924 domain-containing protein n=1 Tax=Aspergillus ellipticus CBS 707.79 TaxID=1448320 RepID=A0A319D4E2_9EURO|nr:hypothetical protein BO71DRAFT_411296 [Aspergillus ellipticus CBS 707.79]